MFVLVWSQVQHGSGSINHVMIAIRSISSPLISGYRLIPSPVTIGNRDLFHTLCWRSFQFNSTSHPSIWPKIPARRLATPGHPPTFPHLAATNSFHIQAPTPYLSGSPFLCTSSNSCRKSHLSSSSLFTTFTHSRSEIYQWIICWGLHSGLRRLLH